MKISKPFICVAVLTSTSSLFSISSIAGNLEAGRAKAEMMCQTCHGMDGQALAPMVAHISGQQEDYLAAQLENYRSGKRHHEQMTIISQSLTDEDIANLATWYSSIKVTIETPE